MLLGRRRCGKQKYHEVKTTVESSKSARPVSLRIIKHSLIHFEDAGLYDEVAFRSIFYGRRFGKRADYIPVSEIMASIKSFV